MTDIKTSIQTLSRTRWALVVFALVTIFAVLGQAWWAVAQDKQQTMSAETTNGLVAARLLEEHASQTVQDAVYTLDRVAGAVRLSRDADDPEAIRKVVAAQDISHSRHLKALQYVSPQGVSWISSPDYPTHQVTTTYRNHIHFLLSHPGFHEALVGRPQASPYDSQWVIPVARTVFNQAGQPVGVISVDIRLSYFGNLYARVAKENNASVTLLYNDGYILVRSPFEARFVGRDVSDAPELATLRQPALEGSFSANDFLDDDEGTKLYTYRKLPGFPITTVYARDYKSVLVPWERRTIERVIQAVLTAALTAALTSFLWLYIRRLQATQHSLRGSEAKFMGLFQQSPTASVLVGSRSGLLVEVNDAWLEQFGYQRDEVLGRSGVQLNLWVEPAEQQRMVKAVLHGDALIRDEVHLRCKNGEELTCLMSGRTFSTATDTLTIFCLIDVTRQRAVEQEIRDINQQLELRVQARTETLEVANKDLSQALKTLHTMQTEMIRSEKMAALGSLVAGIAHELNTPIGISVTVGSTLKGQVLGMVEALNKGELRRSALKEFIDNALQGTDILMRSLERASELVGSFKRVAVDQSNDQRRAFDLQYTLKEVAFTLEPMYKKTPYRLSIDLPAGVQMDSYPGALGQLVTNFISNALHHGFEGRASGQMALSGELSSPGWLTLHFKDDGIGMTQDTLKRVYDPFFTTKLGQGGSGLGMNIVYNIVREMLGGNIDITSELGVGTHITIHMPLIAPQAVATVG